VYGRWFSFAFGFAAVVLLGVALIASVYAPIFAVVIALLIALAFILNRATRRTQQLGSEHAAAAEERRQAGQPARPSASAAPHSGEG
jgi:MFS superfamily sulfate permease-like transporter